MTTAVSLWRIAKETPDYRADDMSGAGAAKTGNRWNNAGTPVVYCASSIALAAMELFVHLGAISKLRNFYLLRIVVPKAAWAARVRVDESKIPMWNAVPSGMSSMTFGTAWARSNSSLLMEVPSVVIPEEGNVLINPQHPYAASITIHVQRQFQFDPRMDK